MPFFLITRTISLLPVHDTEDTVTGLARVTSRSEIYLLQKLTSIDVRKQDEGFLVEGEQSIKHQPIDLDGMLDISGDGVLQSHDVVPVLDLIALTVKRAKHHPHFAAKVYLFAQS